MICLKTVYIQLLEDLLELQGTSYYMDHILANAILTKSISSGIVNISKRFSIFSYIEFSKK